MNARDQEMTLMRVLSKRLKKTEDEIAALEPAARKRIKDYLRERFGWFAREEDAAS